MKTLRLKLYQNLCNYRKEGGFGYIQTYPLPTPSMVRGMVHSVLGLTEYNPLKISIQGKSDGVVTNLQRVYKFDRDPKSRPQNPYIVYVKKSQKTATHSILFLDLQINVNLIIHISFKNESLNDRLFNAINEKIITLGRNEDIVRVDEAKLVDIATPTSRSVITKLPMYVLPNYLGMPSGTRLRLPFYYRTVESFEENRFFYYVDVNYVGEGTSLIKEQLLEDEEGNIVCFLNCNYE